MKNGLKGVTKNDFRILCKKIPGKEIGFQKGRQQRILMTLSRKEKQKNGKKRIPIKLTPIDKGMPKTRRTLTNLEIGDNE